MRPSYPQGTIDIEAARITSPATMMLNGTTLGDRDGDGSPDTVQVNYSILSNAFFEDLDVDALVRDSNGTVVDSISTAFKQEEEFMFRTVSTSPPTRTINTRSALR